MDDPKEKAIQAFEWQQIEPFFVTGSSECGPVSIMPLLTTEQTFLMMTCFFGVFSDHS
ncbi:hypothetical protein HispidOSU_024898, partial [Sigmodon hispidus]